MSKRQEKMREMPQMQPGVGRMEHFWQPKPSGMGPMIKPSRWEVAGLVLVAIVVCIVGRFVLADPQAPQHEASYGAQQPGSSSVLTVAAWTFAGAMGLVLIVGAVALAVKIGASAWKTYMLAKIEVEKARFVPKAETGLSGMRVTPKGAVADLDAAHGPVVDRNGRVVPPTPEEAAGMSNWQMTKAMMAAGRAGAQVQMVQDEKEPAYLERGSGGDWNRLLDDGVE